MLSPIIESAYIIYMLRYFKTQYEIHHPLEYFITKDIGFIKHPIYTSKYESKICPLGNIGCFILTFLILLRWYMGGKMKKWSRIVLFITMYLSMLNMNAIIYLLPVFIYELMLT